MDLEITCPRCLQLHKLSFYPLTNPCSVWEFQIMEYAFCGNLHEPVLMIGGSEEAWEKYDSERKTMSEAAECGPGSQYTDGPNIEPEREEVSDKPWFFIPTASEYEWASQPRKLSELNLDSLMRAKILEWFAFKIWVGMNEKTDGELGGKSYDPLTIELNSDGSGVAHSYVFNFKDGGRHHPFASLDQLEEWLFDELIDGCEYIMHSNMDEPNE